MLESFRPGVNRKELKKNVDNRHESPTLTPRVQVAITKLHELDRVDYVLDKLSERSEGGYWKSRPDEEVKEKDFIESERQNAEHERVMIDELTEDFTNQEYAEFVAAVRADKKLAKDDGREHVIAYLKVQENKRNAERKKQELEILADETFDDFQSSFISLLKYAAALPEAVRGLLIEKAKKEPETIMYAVSHASDMEFKFGPYTEEQFKKSFIDSYGRAMWNQIQFLKNEEVKNLEGMEKFKDEEVDQMMDEFRKTLYPFLMGEETGNFGKFASRFDGRADSSAR